MASETIEDIVREMREHIGNGLCLEFADRIEAAAMRIEHEMNDLCDENARLRAALKPVLECDTVRYAYSPTALRNAVRECQRIYTESKTQSLR